MRQEDVLRDAAATSRDAEWIRVRIERFGEALGENRQQNILERLDQILRRAEELIAAGGVEPPPDDDPGDGTDEPHEDEGDGDDDDADDNGDGDGEDDGDDNGENDGDDDGDGDGDGDDNGGGDGNGEDDGDDNGGDDGNGGGGAQSEADYSAASSLLLGSMKVQLIRPRASKSPFVWHVFGPRTRLEGDPADKIVDPATVGDGDTIAEALGSYQQKTGDALSPGRPLTLEERELLDWYLTMDATDGPTAVRRDQQGRYHGEWFRTGGTSQHEGPREGLLEVLLFLRDEAGL